ncbi:glycosyltransferase family 2 protein [Flavobacteriales bacterium]|nr:glycosyltransferase family 2 protein [Flavobacteriales bacterium]
MQRKPEGTILICLTPVVNEAFELDRFLQSASVWADHIIAGYQESNDNTLNILNSYEKVTVINSPNTDWNELVMRSLLYDAAREIEADKRIIMNLDADELISANFLESAEWNTILALSVGSVIRMQWCNLLDNISSYVPSNLIEVGFVDDGKSTLKGSVMHMGRVPWPSYDIEILKCNELKLLHYQLTNMERQRSKSLWYRAYEKVGKGEFGPIIYRKYSERNHRINAQKTKEEWLYGYQKLGIDVTSVAFGYDYSHDYRLLDYLDEYGASYFRMVNIWSKDWVQFAQGKKVNPERFKDPRNRLDRLIFKYMDWSVHTNKNVIKRISIRLVDAILKLIRYSS